MPHDQTHYFVQLNFYIRRMNCDMIYFKWIMKYLVITLRNALILKLKINLIKSSDSIAWFLFFCHETYKFNRCVLKSNEIKIGLICLDTRT